MRPPAVVQDVLVVWFEFGGFIKRLGCFFSFLLRQTDHSQPHPCSSIFWVADGFFRHRNTGLIQPIQTELGNAKEEVAAVQARFEYKRLLETGDSLIVLA